MSTRVCVIDIPGLSFELLSAIPANSSLGKWLARNRVLGLTPSLPAVSASVQATLTTGVAPAKHGIISSGLPIFRSAQDQALIEGEKFADSAMGFSFAEQSNQFLESKRFWQDDSGQSHFKTSMIFFHHCLPESHGNPKPAADVALLPNFELTTDSKTTSSCRSDPPELANKLDEVLGRFPLDNFCGPRAGIASSQWITKAAIWVWQHYPVQLQWVAIPHLTFDLQRFGPNSPQAIAAVADVTAAIDPLIDAIVSDGGTIMLLSDFAMRTVRRCVYPNRMLADAGLLLTQSSPDGDVIDFQRSDAVAMVDHQFAHVYAQSKAAEQKAFDLLKDVCRCWRDVQEGAYTMSWKGNRAGNFVLEAFGDAWFDYRWWTDPAKAPTFANRVAIHRKPGVDPLELIAPGNGITHDPSLIHGSHGVTSGEEAIIAGPLGPQKMLYLAVDVAAEITRLLA